MADLLQKTRFAPSPTGFLHLGHIVHLLYVFGLATKKNAQVLFRIEDHDQSRCRPEYQQAIMSDLEWLGFLAHPRLINSQNPSVQSDRFSTYEQAARKLFEQGIVYGCSCSRKLIEQRSGRSLLKGSELRYDGFCRDKGLPFDGEHGLRLRLPQGYVSFEDSFLGTIKQDPFVQCGDVQIRERSGLWSYQFAVVVDDIDEGINWIIRGQDLLDSTGRQILIGKTLGAKATTLYTHHPLLKDQTGRKLAKRDRDAAICRRRLDGEKPEHILGEAALAAGLITALRPLYSGDLPDLFSEF